MVLTRAHNEIVAAHPLGKSLDRARDILIATPKSNEAIVELLASLAASSAAYLLNFYSGILEIRYQIRNDAVRERNKLEILVDRVLDNSPDVDIWTTVFDLIDLDPVDIETCEVIESEVFQELRSCTFRNIGEFFDKFFDPKDWCKEQQGMLNEMMTAHDGTKWASFPADPWEEPIWTWLCSLQDQFLVGAPYNLYTAKNAYQSKGQMDIVVQPKCKESFDSYKDVLVVGEQKRTNDTGGFKSDFCQLARHVRSVFIEQPTRRFVHAFLLSGCTMELWIFDRSGAYSSGPFNIHDKPYQFARAFVGYFVINDDLMGLDTFIKQDGNCRHVILDDRGTKVQFKKAITRRKAIVCRGTTCYITDNSNVAKFSWASDTRELEVKQLRLAEERGVKGVARVVAHCQITTTAQIREGLTFSERARHKFQNVDDTSLATSSAGISGKKRRLQHDYMPDTSSASKKQRPTTKKLEQAEEVHNRKPSLYGKTKDLWENRIYSCLVVSPAGRLISDFSTIRELLESLRDAIKAHRSLYLTGNILHRDISSNNIIITDPATADGFKGMLIDLDLATEIDSGLSGAQHQTGTVQFMAIEVLETVDHTYRHDLESFFYVLLWMCADQSWGNGFARAGEQRPQESLLRRWIIGDLGAIVNAKKGNMTAKGLEKIMNEFPETVSDAVEPLCRRIRDILFPSDQGGDLFFGTPDQEPDVAYYTPIREAYDAAIERLAV